MEWAGRAVAIFALCAGGFAAAPAALQESSRRIDVAIYALQITPDLAAKSISGVERIDFDVLRPGQGVARFDAGSLIVDAMTLGDGTVPFHREGAQVVVDVEFRSPGRHTLSLSFHGTPTRGIHFFPESEQVYTEFSTSQWMVCLDDPSERAALAIDVRVPESWDVVANGAEVEPSDRRDGRVTRSFRMFRDAPSYTYGFAAGVFRRVVDGSARVPLVTLAPRSWSEADARRVLRETGDMFRFFEARAGVAYPDDAYSQVLAAGNPQQEMSGFAVMPAAWGQRVLAGDSDVVLAAHELAHQWWGNHVTNAAWTHFWLNEGMATFMAAAYVEQRSGRDAYERLIGEYRASYETVRDAGHDKPLEFDSWSRPTADDRTIVYRKGAYVLHLLRGELGEEAFWAGLKAYTQEFAGRSVVSREFEIAMARSSGRDLSAFFARWVLRP